MRFGFTVEGSSEPFASKACVPICGDVLILLVFLRTESLSIALLTASIDFLLKLTVL